MSECTCLICPDCAMGQVSVPTNGYPEWDLETCPTCHGSGYIEECVHCAELAEMEAGPA